MLGAVEESANPSLLLRPLSQRSFLSASPIAASFRSNVAAVSAPHGKTLECACRPHSLLKSLNTTFLLVNKTREERRE